MLSDKQISSRLKKLKGDSIKKYTPLKYFRGLKNLSQVDARFKKIMANNFKPFATDKGIKTRKSSYTARFLKKFPDAKSLAQKAKVTGVPLPIIRQIYNKGLAAWKTGHRPGATGQQWGYARVHSFLTGGRTAQTADKYLVEEAKKKMGKAKYDKWIKMFK